MRAVQQLQLAVELCKLASLDRRGFLNQLAQAPKSYLDNSTKNLQAISNPTVKLNRRDFLWNVPRAGVAAHVTGLDRAVVNGVRKTAPAVNQLVGLMSSLSRLF